MRRLLGIFLTTTALAVAADQVPFVAVFTSSVAAPPTELCNGGTGVLIHVHGAGHATYLGQFTATQTYCGNLDGTSFSDGVFTLTGANGDSIQGRSAGFLQQTGSNAKIWGAYLIVGGSGHFAAASGGGSATGTLSPQGVATGFFLVGMISGPNH